METAIYFSNGTLKAVSGQAGKGKVKINRCASVELPEGVLINGVITDETRLQEILTGLRTGGVVGNRAAIVIDSSDILYRAVEIPLMNPAEIQRTVGLEFDNLDTRYDELVLDYSVLESRVGGESKGRILCCAMGKPMLDSYRSLFAAAGIQPTVCDMGLNCLIKAAALFPDLRAKPCVLATIDSRVLSCVLFADGQYLYANRYPLLSAPKTPEYTAEVASRLSAINQFYKSEKGNVALEQVYFYGVTDSTLDLLQSAAPALGMQLRPLPNSPQLSMPEGETRFEPGDYLAAIGCLLRK